MARFRRAGSVLFLRLDDLPGRDAVDDELEVVGGELVVDLGLGAGVGAVDVDGGRADLVAVVVLAVRLGLVLPLPHLVDLVETGAHLHLELAPHEALVLEAEN